jgi:hypothetical protein
MKYSKYYYYFSIVLIILAIICLSRMATSIWQVYHLWLMTRGSGWPDIPAIVTITSVSLH